MAPRSGVRSLLSPSVLLRRNAVYKGVFGGSKGWLAIGGVLWMGRTMKKSLGRNETVVATEVLKPGEFVTLRAIVPPTRKERKAARSAR